MSVVSGGFTAFSCDISAEAKAAFEQAMSGLVGVSYYPVAAASQVVAGTNYAYFCNTQIPGSPLNGAAMVRVFHPLEGPAHITGIEQIRV